MRLIIFCCMFLLVGSHLNAKEISGVMIQETLKSENGSTLHLNGAGIRTKFFMDIYIAELYMENPNSTAKEIVEAAGEKRLVMHILYKAIPQDKLIDGWNEGFANNSSKEQLSGLQELIEKFNKMFVDVTKNQLIVFDFNPTVGTAVTVAGELKGVIPGKEFNDALLRIWLGNKPVTKGLKKELLSYQQ